MNRSCTSGSFLELVRTLCGRQWAPAHVTAGESELPESPKDDSSAGSKGAAGTAAEGKGRDDYSISFKWKRLIIRSDNEPSLLAWLTRVALNGDGSENIRDPVPAGVAVPVTARRDRSAHCVDSSPRSEWCVSVGSAAACQSNEVLEDGRDDAKSSSEQTCSTRMSVTKHKSVVAGFEPTVDCALDTTNAVEALSFLHWKGLMRGTRVIRQLEALR